MTTTTAARPTQKVARPIDKPIRNRAALNEAIAELDVLIDGEPKEGTPAHDRMELLSILIEAYEAEHLTPFEQPTPQEMVRHMAEAKGITPGQVAAVLGGRSRLSDFYRKKRSLSTAQVMNIRELLGIPADLLIPKPQRAKPLLAAAGG